MHHSRCATLQTHFLGWGFLVLDFLGVLLELIQVLAELAVEFPERVGPFQFAVFDFIQLRFHSGGVSFIEEVVEPAVNEHIVYRLAERAGMKASFLLFDVLAILDRGHDRRISRRPANALLFQSFHQRRFCVTRRRFSEMLFRIDLVERQRLALRDQRQSPFVFFIGRLFIATLLVNFQEAVKLQNRPGCAKDKSSGLNIDRGLIKERGHHL